MRESRVLNGRPLRSPRTCLVVNLWGYVTKVSQAGGLLSLPVPFLKGFTPPPPPHPRPFLQERYRQRARLQVRGGRGLVGPYSDRWKIQGCPALPVVFCCCFFSVPSALTDPLSQEAPMERLSYRSPRFSHSCRQNTVTYRCLAEPFCRNNLGFYIVYVQGSKSLRADFDTKTVLQQQWR